METTRYELTIAPDDGIQYINRKTDRLKYFVSAMYWLTDYLIPQGIDYELHLEISQPIDIQQGRCGRLHYHGYITLSEDQLYDYYIDWSRDFSQIGRIRLTAIKDEEKYSEYIIKQRAPMEKQCLKQKVPYKLYNNMDRVKLGPNTVIPKQLQANINIKI